MARLAAIVALLFASACTTSRAVRAYHAGDAAAEAGDRAKAILRYEEAYGRDGGLVGAEVSRIALLARDAAAGANLAEAYAALVKAKAGRVEVVLLGAGIDLVAGKAAEALRAASGLAEAAVVAADVHLGVAGGGCGPLWRHRATLIVDAALATGQPALAKTQADALYTRCGAALRPREAMLLAIVALQAGDVGRARAVAAALDAADPVARRVSAALLLREGRAADALARLDGCNDGPGRALAAQALVALGDARGAAVALAAARAAGVSDTELLPIEGTLALLAGDARRARDLLAGLVARRDGALRWTTAFDLGLCELQLGDLDAARRAFATAVALCDGCAAAKRNLDALTAP